MRGEGEGIPFLWHHPPSGHRVPRLPARSITDNPSMESGGLTLGKGRRSLDPKFGPKHRDTRYNQAILDIIAGRRKAYKNLHKMTEQYWSIWTPAYFKTGALNHSTLPTKTFNRLAQGIPSAMRTGPKLDPKSFSRVNNQPPRLPQQIDPQGSAL